MISCLGGEEVDSRSYSCGRCSGFTTLYTHVRRSQENLNSFSIRLVFCHCLFVLFLFSLF